MGGEERILSECVLDRNVRGRIGLLKLVSARR